MSQLFYVFNLPFIWYFPDGLHLVTFLCTFHSTNVTEDMLLSSVTVQLQDINAKQFLSSKLNKFLDALSTIILVERKWIFMFSIKDDIVSYGSNVLNVTFAVQRPDGQYYSPQYLKERIYFKQSQLSMLSEVTLLPLGIIFVYLRSAPTFTGVNVHHHLGPHQGLSRHLWSYFARFTRNFCTIVIALLVLPGIIVIKW